MKERYKSGRNHNGFFFRDNNGLEIDYIIPNREGLSAFEIKSASTYHSSFKTSLDKVSKIEGLTLSDRNVIYNGEGMQVADGLKIQNVIDYFSS